MTRLRSLVLLSTALAATAVAPLAAAQASNRPQVLAGDGRYVFGQINELSADQYLLDTQTGRLWRLIDTADGTGSVLEPIPFMLGDGRVQHLPPEPDAALPAPVVPLPPVGGQ